MASLSSLGGDEKQTLAGEGGHSSMSGGIEKQTLEGDAGQGTANSSMNSSSHSKPCTSGEGGQQPTSGSSAGKPSCEVESTASDATPRATDAFEDSAPSPLAVLPSVFCPASSMPVPRRSGSPPSCTPPDTVAAESMSCTVQETRSSSAKAPDTCTLSPRLWSKP